MYCGGWSASDYNKNHRILSINAAWVEISIDGKVVFSRKADDTGTGEWFDETHRKIYEACRTLEELVLSAPVEKA